MEKDEKHPLSVIPGQKDTVSPTDPQGSWTGVPKERYEVPVQDADDL